MKYHQSSHHPISYTRAAHLSFIPLCSSEDGGGPATTKSDKSATAEVVAPPPFCSSVLLQTAILTKKNFLVQVRSTTALMTQLFIGVIFLAILRLMQLSVESNPAFASDFYALREPEPKTIDYPLPCFAHAWDQGCFSFVAAPNGTDALGSFAATVSARMAEDAGFGGRGENKGCVRGAEEHPTNHHHQVAPPPPPSFPSIPQSPMVVVASVLHCAPHLLHYAVAGNCVRQVPAL